MYVGGFDPRRVTEIDLKDQFRKFGRVRDVIMKPGFAFIGFEELRDAKDVRAPVLPFPFRFAALPPLLNGADVPPSCSLGHQSDGRQ